MAAAADIAAAAPRDFTALLTAILAHILSFLPLRTALLCGTFSRAFMAALREMLACAADFEFGPHFFAGLSLEQYSAALDRALAAHEAATLDSLKIFFPAPESTPRELSARPIPPFEAWLRLGASKRARVLQLEFLGSSTYWRMSRWPVPGSAFNSASLTHLSFGGFLLSAPLEPLQLPSLQALSLRRVDITGDQVTGFLCTCPALAALKLVQCSELGELKVLHPPCLATLTIIDCYAVQLLEIDAPSLKSFHLAMNIPSCDLYEEIVLHDVSGLEDVYFSVPGCWCYEPQLITCFLHVTDLTFSEVFWLGEPDHSEALANLLAGLLPLTFHNLKNLHFPLESDVVIETVCGFFANCSIPALESLFIEVIPGMGPVQEVDLLTSFLPVNELRVITIKGLACIEDRISVAVTLLARQLALDTLVLFVNEMDSPTQLIYELATRWNQLVALTLNKKVELVLCVDYDLARMALPLPPHADIHEEVERAMPHT